MVAGANRRGASVANHWVQRSIGDWAGGGCMGNSSHTRISRNHGPTGLASFLLRVIGRLHPPVSNHLWHRVAVVLYDDSRNWQQNEHSVAYRSLLGDPSVPFSARFVLCN